MLGLEQLLLEVQEYHKLQQCMVEVDLALQVVVLITVVLVLLILVAAAEVLEVLVMVVQAVQVLLLLDISINRSNYEYL